MSRREGYTVNTVLVRSLHWLYMLVWLVSDYLHRDANQNIKYPFMLVTIVVAFVVFWINKCKIRPATVIFREHLLYLVFFFGVTLFALIINENLILDLRDLMRIGFPALYAFLLINTDTVENKDFYMDSILITCVICVLLKSIPRMSLSGLLSINFFDSYSPYENHLALEFAFLFVYYLMRKQYGKTFICVVFSILTMKRVQFLFVLVMCVAAPLLKKIKISNFMINAAKFVFFASPFIMDLLLSDAFVNWFNSTFEVNYYTFTMTRLGMFSDVLQYEGSLLGLQAVEQYLTYNIFHSDIIRVYLETSLIGLILYVNCFFNMVKFHRHPFAYAAVILMMLTMFTNPTFQRMHTYIILYFICCVDFEAAAREDEIGGAARRGRFFKNYRLRKAAI